MLCDFVYKEKVIVEKLIESNRSNMTDERLFVETTEPKKPNWIEYFLMVWIFSFFSDEFRQVIKVFEMAQGVLF